MWNGGTFINLIKVAYRSQRAAKVWCGHQPHQGGIPLRQGCQVEVRQSSSSRWCTTHTGLPMCGTAIKVVYCSHRAAKVWYGHQPHQDGVPLTQGCQGVVRPSRGGVPLTQGYQGEERPSTSSRWCTAHTGLPKCGTAIKVVYCSHRAAKVWYGHQQVVYHSHRAAKVWYGHQQVVYHSHRATKVWYGHQPHQGGVLLTQGCQGGVLLTQGCQGVVRPSTSSR